MPSWSVFNMACSFFEFLCRLFRRRSVQLTTPPTTQQLPVNEETADADDPTDPVKNLESSLVIVTESESVKVLDEGIVEYQKDEKTCECKSEPCECKKESSACNCEKCECQPCQCTRSGSLDSEAKDEDYETGKESEGQEDPEKKDQPLKTEQSSTESNEEQRENGVETKVSEEVDGEERVNIKTEEPVTMKAAAMNVDASKVAVEANDNEVHGNEVHQVL